MNAAALHVGVNVSNTIPKMRSPIFWDGTFKFIPFVDESCENCPTYRDLGLASYIPSEYVSSKVHYDPEFETFTYGDYSNIRTHSVRRLSKGDFLFFITSLQYHRTADRERKPWIHPVWAFYIIGYFEIEEIYNDVELKDPKKLSKVHNNAHVRRRNDKNFRVWKGSQKSKLLKVAVPLSNKLVPTSDAKMIFDSKGPRWWQTSLISGERLQELWDLIGLFNIPMPGLDA